MNLTSNSPPSAARARLKHAALLAVGLGLSVAARQAGAISDPAPGTTPPATAPAAAQPLKEDPAKENFLSTADTSEFDEALDLGRAVFDVVDLLPRDPIPGAPVTLVYTLRNADSENWAVGDIKLQYDLFDSQKRLLLREELPYDNQPVDMGMETVGARSTFDIPATVEGVVFLKVRVTVKGQLVLISSPQAMTVNAGPGKEAKRGKVKFSIAGVALSERSPKVGETVLVDVLVKNDGAAATASGVFSAKLELKAQNGKAVGKAKPVVLKEELKPDASGVIQLSVKVPAPCEQKCLVMASVMVKGEKKPVAAPPVPLKALPAKGVNFLGMNITGDTTLVYTNNPKQSIPGSTPPTNLKFKGPGFAGSIKGLAIARDVGGKPQMDDFSGRNFVGEFATKNLKIKAGRFTPSYNEFTVNGKEMEAREVYYKAGPFLVSALHGRTAKASDASKTYQRTVRGGSLQYQPGKTRRARVGYFYIDDKIDSLSLAKRAGTKPVSGAVYSFDADWQEHRHTMRLGHALSRVNENVTGANTRAGFESATKYRHAIKFKRQTHELDFVRVDSNYVAISSPGAKNATKWATVNTFKLNGLTVALKNSRADNNLRNTVGNNVINRSHGVNVTVSEKKLLLNLLPNLNVNTSLTRQDGMNKPNTAVNNHTVVNAFATKWDFKSGVGVAANYSTTAFDDETTPNKDTNSQRLGLNIGRSKSRFQPTFTFNQNRQKVLKTKVSTRADYWGLTMKLPFSARFQQTLAASYSKNWAAGKPSMTNQVSLTTKMALPRWRVNLSLNQNFSTTNNTTSKEKFTFVNVATLSRKINDTQTLFFDYKYTRKPPAGTSAAHSVFLIRLNTKI